MEIDLTLQIVNFNTKEYLQLLLKDLSEELADCDGEYEVLIADNNSSDDLSDLEQLFSTKIKNLRFYKSEQNLGFGGGHNFLSDKGSGEYILFLNPDIRLVGNGSISKLLNKIKELDRNKKTKVVGPQLISELNETQHFDHGTLKGLKAFLLNNLGGSYWKDEREECNVAWVSGAVLIIERKIFEAVGKFDEKFFLYKEEEDLCKRIRNLGYNIAYSPQITFQHKGGVVAKKEIHFKKSKEYFLKKHFSMKLWYPLIRFVNRYI